MLTGLARALLAVPALAQPAAPTAVTVAPAARTTGLLDIGWTAPSGTVTDYDLRYRPTDATVWADGPQNVSGTSVRLRELEPNISYDVQVRASNGSSNGAWSATAVGWTHARVEELHYSEQWGRIPRGLGPGDSFRLLSVVGSTALRWVWLADNPALAPDAAAVLPAGVWTDTGADGAAR